MLEQLGKVAIFYFIIGLLFYLNRGKVELQGPVVVLRSKLFSRLLRSIKSNILLRTEPVVIITGLAGMLFVTYFLLSSIYDLIVFGCTRKVFSIVLPGLRVPGTEIELPIFEGFIILFICIFVHEFGHALYARIHNIRIKSTGFALLGPLLGAFVELDENELEREDLRAKLAVSFSGPFLNIILYLVLFVVYQLLAPLYFSSFKVVDHIVKVEDVKYSSPAWGAGLRPGTLIFAVNGKPIENFTEFIKIIKNVAPYTNVSFLTSNGQIVIIPANKSGEPYYGFVVSPYVIYKNKLLFDILNYVLFLISLLAALSLGIGLANLLPMMPLDGGKALYFILQERLSTDRAQKITIKVSLVLLALLLFNMIVGLFYGGRLW